MGDAYRHDRKWRSPFAGLQANFVHDKGRSHQQPKVPSQRGWNSAPTRADLREHRHFGEAVVSWRSPSHFVGDSVLYHSLFGLASARQILGTFVRNADYTDIWYCERVMSGRNAASLETKASDADNERLGDLH